MSADAGKAEGEDRRVAPDTARGRPRDPLGRAVTPRPAATVVLVRDSTRGPETLLLERPRGGFASESWVFPGGVLDATDYRLARVFSGETMGLAARMRIADAGEVLAYLAAAIRETWEETGLLVGSPGEPDERSAVLRRRALRGDLDFDGVREALGLQLDTRLLEYIARWVTPPEFPRRYDTRFFVAPAAPDARPSLLSGEIVDFGWFSPEDALDRHRSGKLKMMPPTAHTIQRLIGYRSTSELVETLGASPVVEFPSPARAVDLQGRAGYRGRDHS